MIDSEQEFEHLVRHRSVTMMTGVAGRYVACLLLAAVIVTPLVIAVVSGFRDNGSVQRRPIALPAPWIFSNYLDILKSTSFWRQVFNSITIMTLTTVMVVSMASAVAFVLARMQFRGREAIFNFFTVGLLFPLPVAILPLYLLLRQLELVDTLWGIILPQVAFGLPLNVLLLRSFFIAVPAELEDAAYVDGATPLQFLLRILLPLVKPALAAVSVLAMVGSWNNFFLPLVVLNSDSLWPLPLGVIQYRGEFSTDWARVLAFVSLALTPAVAFYLVAERHIVTGLTAGSIKG